MALLYADEQFPRQVVILLRALGHDVLTVQEAGKAGLKIPDDQVLEFATSEERAVLTLNRQDFFRLHRLNPEHAGIIACKDDSDRPRMATRINEVISIEKILARKVIRVNRPSS